MAWVRLSRRAMACEFEVVATGEDSRALGDIAELALDEVERLEERFSCFRATSEVSYLNSEAALRPVIVSPDLFEILRVAKDVWRDTNGAFDVTAGPLVGLWRKAEQIGFEPHSDAIEAALTKVGMAHVLLDEATHAVQFDSEGVRINLGAIGKGYAVGKAASILTEYGVESARVSGGGSSVQGIGPGPDGDGWKVGIRHPSKLDERVEEIVLRDQAMSTSGGPAQRDPNVREHFEHIIDPVTGAQAHSEAASVTVISGDAMLSDALATAFYLRGRELADAYCAGHEGVRTIFVSFE
jgi:thiamine biosynthesis lipoprotein